MELDKRDIEHLKYICKLDSLDTKSSLIKFLEEKVDLKLKCIGIDEDGWFIYKWEESGE